MFLCTMGKKSDYKDVFLKQLGDRIKSLRKAKGYSNYEQFAFTHGIARAQYGRYENGADMRISSLLKIIQAFDMNVEEFFSEGFDEGVTNILK